MIITLHNPEYFTLIHKKSGKKINTLNSTFISYDDEKFIKEKEMQKTLF